jgi:hypothetical protein
METEIDVPDDAAASSTRVTLRISPWPLAVCPWVFTLMLQGSTVIVLPTVNGEGGRKVDCVIVKWHEPKVVVPVAVSPPELMENAGVVDVLVNATVVVAVVPNDETPPGYENAVFMTAAVVVGEAGSEAFVAAT